MGYVVNRREQNLFLLLKLFSILPDTKKQTLYPLIFLTQCDAKKNGYSSFGYTFTKRGHYPYTAELEEDLSFLLSQNCLVYDNGYLLTEKGNQVLGRSRTQFRAQSNELFFSIFLKNKEGVTAHVMLDEILLSHELLSYEDGEVVLDAESAFFTSPEEEELFHSDKELFSSLTKKAKQIEKAFLLEIQKYSAR